MRRSPVMSALLVALLVFTVGCHSWSTIEPGEVASHDLVRVTLRDDGEQAINEPRVVGDSIEGEHERKATTIPLEEVTKIESRSTNVAGTILVVAGSALGGLILIAMIQCATSDNLAC